MENRIENGGSLVFPSITGDLLSGGQVVIPEYIEDSYSILTLVFEINGEYQKAQDESLEWQAQWEKEWKTLGLGFYEIPLINKEMEKMNFMVNQWMQEGIDETFHGNVVTVYGQKDFLQSTFGIEDLSRCFTCLMEKKGKVLNTFVGGCTSKNKKALKIELEGLLL